MSHVGTTRTCRRRSLYFRCWGAGKLPTRPHEADADLLHEVNFTISLLNQVDVFLGQRRQPWLQPLKAARLKPPAGDISVFAVIWIFHCRQSADQLPPAG